MGLPVPLGAAEQVTAQGTFYAPTYSATATASSALNNTTLATLTVNYAAATTMTTSLGAHQSVTVTAQPGDTFTSRSPAGPMSASRPMVIPAASFARLVQRRTVRPVLRLHRRHGHAGHAAGARDLLGDRRPDLHVRHQHAIRHFAEPWIDIYRLGFHHDNHADGIRRVGQLRGIGTTISPTISHFTTGLISRNRDPAIFSETVSPILYKTIALC